MIRKNLQDVKGLIGVASAGTPPDVLIKNVEILSVFNGELFKGDIWIYKYWIAYVGNKTPSISEKTTIIDGTGYVAVPGYIDAHSHADLFYNPATFSDYVVTRGATTVFSDAHDMVNSIGVKGFIEVLNISDTLSVKFLWGVPAAHPHYPDVEGIEMLSLADMRMLFSQYPDCISMSELSSYMRVLKNEDDILEKILLAHSFGRNVEGHALGASYDMLNVLAAAGINSCHESIRAIDLRNRVRLGFSTMVRHGSIRSDLKDLCAEIERGPKDSLILVSDGVFAADLIANGYMDHVLREAIGYGLKPQDAIRMVTLNPARYFGLDGEIGSIAQGRIADILLLQGLENPTPDKVVERGRLVAEKGILKGSPATFPEIGTSFNPYIFHSVDKEDFCVEKKSKGPVPVIDIIDRTVTRRIDLTLLGDNVYLPDRANDVQKVVYTRRDKKKWGKGFVRGIGASIGAVALTVCHDTHGLLITGFDDADMELAANEALAMGGGIVIVDNREILCEMPLPIGATMSRLPIHELADDLEKANRILRDKGSSLSDPIWTIAFLTLTSIVELRITVSGVYDVKKATIVF